ncbi:MAG: hypothetical protein ACE5FA_14990 [Dehalococcoidia bacterium]
MPKSISTEHLEEYLAGTLSPTAKRRVESALGKSDELRRQLDALKAEAGTIEAVKDSLSIRLPERDEERIVSRAVGGLNSTLGRAHEEDR